MNGGCDPGGKLACARVIYPVTSGRRLRHIRPRVEGQLQGG